MKGFDEVFGFTVENFEKGFFPGTKVATALNRRLERLYPGITKTTVNGVLNDGLFLDKLIKKFDNDRKGIKRKKKFPTRK